MTKSKMPYDTDKEKRIQKHIDNAVASMEMEGFHVSEESKELCKKMLMGEITYEEYMEIIVEKIKKESDDLHMDQ